MKRNYLFGALTLAFLSTLALSANAQEKKESVGQAIGKTATKVGNKTAEVAVKGTAKVADKVYTGKAAPDGSDVYINGKNKKYYINKKGKKIFLKASQIKDRPVEKK